MKTPKPTKEDKAKAKAEGERAELRGFLKQREDIAKYIAGQGPFCAPFSVEGMKRFAALAKRYKYEDEFRFSML